MSDAGKFFDTFQNNLIGSLNTCAIGQIVKYDPVKAKADVTILPDGEMALSVPVAMPQTKDFFISLPYAVGDYVVIVFAQRDIDGIMNGGDATPSERMLSLDDAIIVGGINLFTSSMAGASTTDIIIGKKDGSTKIKMDKDGKIDITNAGGAGVTLSPDGSLSITAAKSISVSSSETISFDATKGISITSTDVTGSGVTITGKNTSGSW